MKFSIFYLCVLTISASDAWNFDRVCTFNCTFVAHLTTPTGLLTSPNYPNSYPGPMIYTYKITQPEGYIIHLSISDINLGWNNTDSNSTDRLTIFDGDQDIFNRIDSLSGSRYFFPGRTYNSTTNHLLLQFKAFSNERKYRGFHATYQAIDMKCGGILRSNNGTIKHPKAGIHYVKENCDWIIQAPPGYVVNITRIAQDIYPSDYLTIREWRNGNFEVLFRRSGSSVYPSLVTTGSIVYVNFKHVDARTSHSFTLDYQFVNLSNFSENELASIQAN